MLRSRSVCRPLLILLCLHLESTTLDIEGGEELLLQAVSVGDEAAVFCRLDCVNISHCWHDRLSCLRAHTETALVSDCMHTSDSDSALEFTDLFGDFVRHSHCHPCGHCRFLSAVTDVHHLGDVQSFRLSVHLSGIAALTRAVNANLQNQADYSKFETKEVKT